MPRLVRPLLAVACLSAIACSDASTPSPTQPHRLDVTASAACDDAIATQIYADIDVLFVGKVRTEARSRFTKIKNDCQRRRASAVDEMLDYVQFTIGQYPANVQDPNGSAPPTRQEALVAHWDLEFAFLALQQPLLPPSVLDPTGAVRVCDASGCSLATATQLAGLLIPPNIISEKHLFAIAPLASCVGLTSKTNLDLIPLCFDFSVNPVTAFRPPFATVTVCEVEGTASELTGRSLLSHTVADEGGTLKLLPRRTDPFGFTCSDAAVSANETDVGSSPLAAGWRLVGRLAARAFALLGPQSLYARHGGLTGGTGSLSPFGGVDPVIFKATFTNDVVGQQPGPPEKGAWTLIAPSPSTILVQAALGNLTTKPVVLNQQGGNGGNSGALELRGTVKNAPPTDGTYSVSWRSVVGTPVVGLGSIVLRDAIGFVLARVDYRAGHNAKSGPITYNSATRTVATWSQNIAQSFEITVDLKAQTTSLKIDGTAITGAQGLTYVDRAAVNLARISVEVSGTDIQTLGWDDILITRLADPLPSN